MPTSPLRAFRGALVCLSEGSNDTSMMHLACHFAQSAIERCAGDDSIDEPRVISEVLAYLWENVQSQHGALRDAYIALHGTLDCLASSQKEGNY